MRVTEAQCPSCDRLKGERHIATEPPPSMDELEDMVFDIITPYATDGCDVEPDGHCEHGHPSWLLKLTLI